MASRDTVVYEHNDRGYYGIYNKLSERYPKYPQWFFKEMGGLIEFNTDLQNNIALDILYPETRESAYAFADRCGYVPVESAGATTEMTITLNSAMAKILAIGYQVAGISASTGKLVHFELTEAGNSGGTDTITADATQKRTYTDIDIGTIKTQDEFYEVPIDGYVNIIKTSISLTINSLSWTRVDNLDNSTDTDKHFVLVYQNNGAMLVMFGNGTRGEKPPLGYAVLATFATTQGLSGIMDSGEINTNLEGDTDISSVTNTSTSGGNNSESVPSIIRNAKIAVRSKEIIWSEEDLELHARAADASVVKALGIGGVGTAEIIIIPSGGGAPSSGLKTIVKNYTEALSQFGLMPMLVSDPTYDTQNISATITKLPGFDPTTVENLVDFGMTLVSSAYDIQVLDSYDTSGIDICRTDVINVLWSWAFVEADNSALAHIIEKWKSLLGNRDYREWGQELEVGNLWIMGDSLYSYGVDVFALTLPTSNVTPSSDEIIDTGTVTIT